MTPAFYCFSEYLQNKGVDCFYDNIKLILTSHVVYICVLPSQIPSIAEELKHNIPPTVILYSLVSTYTTKKLKQILLTTNIIHPEFNWTEESHTNHWDCTLNVNAALENRETVEKTCPIGFKKSGKFLMINIEFQCYLISLPKEALYNYNTFEVCLRCHKYKKMKIV